MPRLELFGSSGCPYTREMREWLEWTGREFIEYDVDVDRAARERLRTLASGYRIVPILVEDGKAVQVGWEGRGCAVSLETGG